MIPQERRLNPIDKQQDKQAYNYWFRHTFGERPDEGGAQYIYRVLYRVIQEELTDKMRRYFTAYYFEGLTMAEIGEMYGKNKSTVSRVIGMARKRVGRVLRYTNPRFAHYFDVEHTNNRANNKAGTQRFTPKGT